MNVGTLMPSEPDEAHLALLFGFEDRFHAASLRENAIRIGVANHFMELQQIDVISLQATQRFFELLRCSLLCAPIDFGHQKGFLAISIAERLAHADFALAVVVIPAVVEKSDAGVESSSDDANAFLLVRLHAEMITTQSHNGDPYAGASQGSNGNVLGAGVCEFLVQSGHESSSGGGCEELSPIHASETPGSK